MAQIKITHTSNADMNIGVPKQITMAQDDYKIKSTETVTNNHRLTAVEWLFQKMTEQGTNPYWDMRFIQAKQMEKEQIINAWRSGDNDSMYEIKQLDEQAEQYYNETYNK